MTDEQKLQAFLDELSALTRKHGFVISGCGCCGSPSVDPANQLSWYVPVDDKAHYVVDGNLQWVKK